jgi:hypothetical protein
MQTKQKYRLHSTCPAVAIARVTWGLKLGELCFDARALINRDSLVEDASAGVIQMQNIRGSSPILEKLPLIIQFITKDLQNSVGSDDMMILARTSSRGCQFLKPATGTGLRLRLRGRAAASLSRQATEGDNGQDEHRLQYLCTTADWTTIRHGHARGDVPDH